MKELAKLELIDYNNDKDCCETCVLFEQCCCNFDNYNEEIENLIDKCVEKGGNHHYIINK